MNIINVGELEIDQDTEKVESIVNNWMTSSDFVSVEFDDIMMTISFEEEPGDIEDNLIELDKALKDIGAIVSGEIEYVGDYDGFYIVNEYDVNGVKSIDKEDAWYYKETDTNLINALKARGYDIISNKIEKE